jgi:hypothetical protein
MRPVLSTLFSIKSTALAAAGKLEPRAGTEQAVNAVKAEKGIPP